MKTRLLAVLCAFTFMFGFVSHATAIPVITSGNILVDDAAATGFNGAFIPGDVVVILWDNSVAGDNNVNVYMLSQVTFDVFGITNMTADNVFGGIFSVNYIFPSNVGNFYAAVAGVTATDSSGTTGPVYGLSTHDIMTGEASIVPIPAALWLFGTGLLGLIGVAKRKKAIQHSQ